jgi:hypothetical protein
MLVGWSLGHVALLLLPATAAALMAIRRGVRDLVLLIGIGLATGGVVALGSFWSYWIDHGLGVSFVVVSITLSVVAILVHRRILRRESGLLLALAVPAGLLLTSTVFVLSMGFLHGGVQEPLRTPAVRWSDPGGLPGDSLIPLLFAESVLEVGNDGPPPVFFGDWLSSDRPPLQSGVVLSQRVFAWDSTGLHYEVVSVAAQQLWVVGLWALLLASGVGRRVRAVAAVTLLASDVALVNGFFVWPKLLPTAYLLVIAAIVLSPAWRGWSRSSLVGVLVGTLAALATLAHGGSIFGLVPLAAVGLVRARPSLRWLLSAASMALVVMLPWALYQRLVDPPGNRLVKWHLAGVVAPDDRGLGEALSDMYRSIGPGTAIRYKLDNLTTMLGPAEAWWHPVSGLGRAVDGRLAEASALIRHDRFFYLVPSVGFLLLAPLVALVVVLVRRLQSADLPLVPEERRPEWRLGVYCLAIALVGALVWASLMFGPGTTLIHQGALLLPVMLMLGLLMTAAALSPRAAVALAGLNVVTVGVLYGPWDNGLPYSGVTTAMALASLAAFCLQAWTGHPVNGTVPPVADDREAPPPVPKSTGAGH